MVSSRKRGRQEMEADPDPISTAPKEPGMLERIRNMWEFANLSQWIFIFGKAVKIDENLDIEELEMECLKTQSTVLSEIGLALLKFVSSHRGLTPEIFDEYARRQYVAKAPQRNPFGEEEEPLKFAEFDVFTKIRVLQQLTQWTFNNPDRIRERMEEQKDSEQTYWRVEPFGWDAEDRSYIVLDDNRLYRQTDAPPPPAPKAAPKKNSKKARAALRASKRRRVSENIESDEEAKDEVEAEEEVKEQISEDNGLGGAKWECIAITLDELNSVIDSLKKSRDPNEKVLRERIVEDLLPLLEKQEESRKRKQAQKERELLNLEKLALAKRSSRIAGKLEQQKQDEEAKEAERKRQAELIMAKKEQERWQKLEKERESRMQTREQRIKEREARRILHEAELAALSEDSKKLETGEGRLSERHLKAEMERKKAALEELADDEDWTFDCICGAHGQVDDGTHSIACEKCNVWQHTKCVGISEADAGREDFEFVCKTCKKREKDAEDARKRKIKEEEEAKRREEEAKRRKAREEERRAKELEAAKNRPPSGIKIKFPRPGSSSGGPPTPQQNGAPLSPYMSGHYANSVNLSPQKSPSIPQQSPSKPSYTSPFANGGQAYPQPHMSPYANSPPSYRPSASPPRMGVFNPPQPHSPTILPPPNPARNYTSVTQSHSSTTTNGAPNTFSSPAATYYQQGSIHATPANRPAGQQGERRPSMGFPSPMNGAPILQPSPSYKAPSPTNGHGPYNTTGGTAPAHAPFSPTQPFSTPAAPHSSTRPNPDPGHLSALPPASTGISPTKNSPPRSTSSSFDGHITMATPHSIPAVPSLNPSPQAQNLTPPVKTGLPIAASTISAVVSPIQNTLPRAAEQTAKVVEAAIPPPQLAQASSHAPAPAPIPMSAQPSPTGNSAASATAVDSTSSNAIKASTISTTPTQNSGGPA